MAGERGHSRIAPPAPGGRRGGFTLLELLLASVVLAAGLAIVVDGISVGTHASQRTRRQAAALHLAADRLAITAADAAGPDAGQDFRCGMLYDWTIDRRGHADPRLEVLVCEVRWTARGRDRTVSLQRVVRIGGGT